MKHNLITSISKIKIAQIAKWLKLLEGFNEAQYRKLLDNLGFRAQVVAIMHDTTISQAKRMDVDDILYLSNHYIELLASYKYHPPKETIEVAGQKFYFSRSFGKWSTGQIIDAKLLTADDLLMHPERLLAMMYVEQGMLYGQEDEHQSIINPNQRREQLFKEHFDGEEFWNFYNFFLSNYESWKLAITGIQIARMRIARKQTEKMLKRKQREMRWRGILLRAPLLRSLMK